MEWLMELLGKGGGSVMDGYVSPKDEALAEARRTGDKRTVDLIEKGLIDPNEPELPSATSRAIANLQSGDRTRGLGINPSVIDQVEAGIAPPEMQLPSEFDMAVGDTFSNMMPEDPFGGFKPLRPREERGGPEEGNFFTGTDFGVDVPWKKIIDALDNPYADPLGTIGAIKSFTGGDEEVPGSTQLGMDTGEGLMPDDDLLPPQGSYKRPPAGRQGDGTGTAGSPATTGAGVEKAPVDTTPVKENPMNAVQRFARDTLGWDDDKRSDMSRALITGGLATMAGDSPYAMQNIGMGGLAGVDAYHGAKDQRREESLEDDAIAMQKELHEMRMAEGRRAAEKHGIDMKNLKKAQEKGVDPLDLLSGTAKSKAYAEQLFRNGDISAETYKSILGIKQEEEEPF